MALTITAPRLAYQVAGRGGSPVVMIMGFAMRGVVWRPQVEALSGRHRVVTFDNRGVGGSDPMGGLITIREMAQDVLRLVDELELPPFHLVGVSMGGMIAQEAALARPDRLESLTLIATHAGGLSAVLPRRRGIESFLSANLARDRRDRVAALSRLLYAPEFLRTVDRAALRRAISDRTAVPIPASTLAAQLLAVFRHRTDDRLHRLDVPTLIVKPGRDVLVRPRESDRLKRLIPNAALVELADAGHGVTFQRAAAVNEHLLAHFAANE